MKQTGKHTPGMVLRDEQVRAAAMAESKHTPGPWDYVPGTEHHGPYVTTEYGSTVSDCYCMSNPYSLSVRNGGDSKPINHMHEMAEANARLIAAAPELLAMLKDIRKWMDEDLSAWEASVIPEIDALISKAEGR